mmetsp:Transcript_23438/g.48595  ORF Transcript_23438/g.48595 Transcript_23438/m.48595 type:complete len:296 (-) Transcript_23438:138-1025(-)
MILGEEEISFVAFAGPLPTHAHSSRSGFTFIGIGFVVASTHFGDVCRTDIRLDHTYTFSIFSIVDAAALVKLAVLITIGTRHSGLAADFACFSRRGTIGIAVIITTFTVTAHADSIGQCFTLVSISLSIASAHRVVVESACLRVLLTGSGVRIDSLPAFSIRQLAEESSIASIGTISGSGAGITNTTTSAIAFTVRLNADGVCVCLALVAVSLPITSADWVPFIGATVRCSCACSREHSNSLPALSDRELAVLATTAGVVASGRVELTGASLGHTSEARDGGVCADSESEKSCCM